MCNVYVYCVYVYIICMYVQLNLSRLRKPLY